MRTSSVAKASTSRRAGFLIALFAVVACAGVAVSLVFGFVAARFQHALASVPAQSPATAVLDPSSFVCLSHHDAPCPTTLQVPGGSPCSPGVLSLYSVPAGRWLVITDIEYQQSGAPGDDFPCAIGSRTGSVVAVRRPSVFMGNYDEVNGQPEGPWHSSTGVAFPPNSELVLLNRNSVSVTPTYSIVGYLR